MREEIKSLREMFGNKISEGLLDKLEVHNIVFI